MLPKTNQGFSCSTLEEFWNTVSEWNRGLLELFTLQEQRQEGDEEDQENGNNASSDPIENGNEVVASRASRQNVPSGVHFTNQQLLVERSDVQHWGEKGISNVTYERDTKTYR